MIEPSLKRKALTVAAIVFLVLAIPTVGVGAWYYRSFNADLTDQVTSHIQTLQALAAKAVALRLDKLVEMAKSYASQPTLQDAMAQKAWSRGIIAVKTLQDNPAFYDYYFDRIFLIGLDGKINGAFPGIAATDIGTVDSGYPAKWSGPLLVDHASSYISNVVLRSVSPRINVIKILVPVVKDSAIVGVLRFDIPINEFSNLGKNAELTSDGFVYFVDATGQIISHPKISSDSPIVSFASVPSVDRAIHGQSGIDILYNSLEQETRVTAYGQVPGYGWGVIAQEPVDEAFVTRDAILKTILIMILTSLLVEVGIAAVIFAKETRATRP